MALLALLRASAINASVLAELGVTSHLTQATPILTRLFSSIQQATTPECTKCALNDSANTPSSGYHQIPVFGPSSRCKQHIGWGALCNQARGLHTSSHLQHGSDKKLDGESIQVTFVDKDGTEHTVQAPVGKSLMEVAHDNDIDLEGACEGSLACSTCHIVVENEEYFKQLPEATEDELDMLDLAFGLTETSRLGCQVIADKKIDGIKVRIPSASRNFYVDGHKPKPH